jgi:hypothetical protein
MARYRKKPIVIEAIQFTGTNVVEVAKVLSAGGAQFEPDIRFIVIKTLEGDMRADVGDWIIRGVQGEFYPCKPDIFDATYEAAGDDE